MTRTQGPKVLLFDIETSPIIAHVWALFDQTVSLNQIQTDWHLLAWAAKWLGDSKLLYADQRSAKDMTNDKKILQQLWNLLDEADIVVTQNGKAFDVKKVNARFVFHGMQPPSSFKQIDTLLLAKKHFGFTSNKLAYMTDKLCTKYKKQEHRKYPGHELWKECLKGNRSAWKEMEKYNKYDVLALEELYHKLIIDFNVYSDSFNNACKCGSKDFIKRGFLYTPTGKFQRYKCNQCGAETRSKENLLSKEKRKFLRPGSAR